VENTTPAVAPDDLFPWPGPDTGVERLTRSRRRTRIAVAGAALTAAAFSATLFLALSAGEAPDVTATFLLQPRVGTLTLSDDPTLRAATQRMDTNVAAAELGGSTTGFYEDSAGRTKRVLISVVHRPENTGGLNQLMALGRRSLTMSDPEYVDAGRAGGKMTCADATSGDLPGVPLVVCAWTDRAGSGLAVLYDRPHSEALDLVRTIRLAGIRES
jgi:hypothetical protein